MATCPTTSRVCCFASFFQRDVSSWHGVYKASPSGTPSSLQTVSVNKGHTAHFPATFLILFFLFFYPPQSSLSCQLEFKSAESCLAQVDGAFNGQWSAFIPHVNS